ncbi:MAG: nitrilase-related carbon-nitrogen hydrolase [Bacteroidota bacterium]
MKNLRKNQSNNKEESAINFLWLLLGCVFLLFMGGKWNLPFTTWIGSIFFLRYFRMRRGFWGILLAFPFILLASHIYFIGLAEQVEPGFKILIAVSYTFYVMIPFLIDRLLNKRIRNQILSTLIYPASLIVIQFILSYVEQLGTILHWTGSMFSFKPLIQLVSITGVWGLSFLVGWLASIINLLWEEKFDLKKVRLTVALFTGLFLLIIFWGSIRLAFFTPANGTVKVGSVIVGFQEDNFFYTYEAMAEKVKLEQKEKYRTLTYKVQDELFATSEKLIPSGIRILSWASGNAVVFAEDEAVLISRMQNFARKNQIYFFPSLLVLGEYKGPDQNHILAIQPDGQIEYDHYKGRNPNANFYQGNLVEIINTPYGRIASPICFEMEFHRFIRQAGKKGVDIFIVPGDEPARGAANMHTELSMLRAIENGCSMLRTTLEGLTMGADYQGRVLSQLDFYKTLDNRTIITELPVKGVKTIYSRAGDWFAWLCVILLVIFITSTLFNIIRNDIGHGHI